MNTKLLPVYVYFTIELYFLVIDYFYELYLSTISIYDHITIVYYGNISIVMVLILYIIALDALYGGDK